MAAGTISPAKHRDKRTSWSVVADRAFVPVAAALVLAFGGSFYGAGLAATGGAFPVPLDDTFIHFDFARALCRGHPFEWIAGQGYSSGETSPLYALVLACGYAAGFRSMSLAVWAAIVASASLVWAMVSLRALLSRAHPLVAYAAAALLVSVGALDFTLFSGMEVALLAGLLLRALVLARRLVETPAFGRAALQWRLGGWGALLVWTRPEAAVVVFVLSVLAARYARSRSPLGALVRVALPGALATLAVLLLNYAMSGDFASAGARLKLLSSNPYLSDLERARELVLNALYFHWRVLEGSVVASPKLLWVVFACAGAALFDRRTRAVAASALASALLFGLLVSFNGAARFQGFRYYAPSVVLLLVAVGLGLGAIARRAGAWAGVMLGVFFVAGAASRAAPQRRFFAEASENIHDQQVRVGRELGRVAPRDARVLVGDAGAIPYVSELTTVDALGLGGYHGVPFVRAALSGEASTIELLQSLPPGERPDWLALYPNWFPGITKSFGTEVTHVTLEHNVICGGPTKGIYRADWSPLDVVEAPRGEVVDELDVADVQSEAAHAYRSPAPRGGFATLAVLPSSDGRPMFDGGRIIPAMEQESFVTRAGADRAVIVVRSDAAIDAEVQAGAGTAKLAAPAPAGRWAYAESAPMTFAAGEVVGVRALAPLRDFHVWILVR